MSILMGSRLNVPSKTKPHIRKKTTAALVAVVVILTVLSVSFFSSLQVRGQSTNGGWLTELPDSYIETILSGEMAVHHEGFQCVGFCVPDGVSYASLQGSFNSTGNATNAAVTVMVWKAEDFSNWLCGRKCNPPEYNADFMPAVSGNMNLTLSSGLYYASIGSAAYNQTQTISIKLDLSYGK
jgi:hypothetical protein